MSQPSDLWSATAVPLHEARLWRLGPLHLHVSRLPWQWTFSWWRDGQWLSGDLHVAEPAAPQVDTVPGLETRRFAFGETADPVSLTPALGDRDFVAVPDQPFFVLPAESIRAFVSVPLWVQVRVGQDARLAAEVPVIRPQDTWFGSPTAGTLCYASRTAMRLELDLFSTLAHRALVTVEVHNRSETPLVIERLKLPVPELSLFRDASGQLRTSVVRFTRQRDDEATIEHAQVAAGWTRLAEPRTPTAGGRGLMQVFNATFTRGL